MTIRAHLAALILVCATSASAETIAIIGTGNVGGAIGAEFAAQGHTIIYGSRSPAGLKALDLARKTGEETLTDTQHDAAQAADVVVLAVPGMVVADVAKELGDLTGKLVIDVTNPLVRDDAMHFSLGAASSNGERVQDILDGALVVKALNTVTWQTMLDADERDDPPTVPLSGDDAEAKQFVAGLVNDMGLVPVDIGGIETSRWSELTAVIKLNNRFSDRQDFDLHLRTNE